MRTTNRVCSNSSAIFAMFIAIAALSLRQQFYRLTRFEYYGKPEAIGPLRSPSYRTFSCNTTISASHKAPTSDWYFPDVLILGAMKTGTGAMLQSLVKSGRTLFCNKGGGEVHFLDHAAPEVSRFDRSAILGYEEGADHGGPLQMDGILLREAYDSRIRKHTLSDNAWKLDSCTRLIDKSPSYLSTSHLVPQRLVCALMAGAKPPKMIALLREPIARTFSHYNHAQRKHPELFQPTDTFEDTMKASISHWKRTMQGPDGATLSEKDEYDRYVRYCGDIHNLVAYIGKSAYIIHLEQWAAVLRDYSHLFSNPDKPFQLKDHLLVIENEALLEDTPHVLARVLDFLDIPIDEYQAQAAGGKPVGNYTAQSEFGDDTEKELGSLFRPYNQRLNAWLDQHGMARMRWAEN